MSRSLLNFGAGCVVASWLSACVVEVHDSAPPSNMAGTSSAALGGSSGQGLGNGGSSSSVAEATGGSANPSTGAPSSVLSSSGNPAGVRCAESTLAPPVLRRLTATEWARTVAAALPLLSESLATTIGPDPISTQGFDNDASLLVVNAVTGQKLLDSGRTLASRQAARLNTDLACSQTSPDRSCAATYLDRVGPRLFRRTLSAAERQRYLDYFASVAARSDFATALGWMVTALIQSPHTLYRSEVGTLRAGERRLSANEIANQLAYAFSGGPPSEELLRRAEAGEFESDAARMAVARELLSSNEGRAALLRFFTQWSDLNRVAVASRPAVANFADVKTAMQQETERFIGEVVLARDGSVRDLLTAPYTFVNGTLSAFYGFGSAGTDFALTQRPPKVGIGLLAQGAILTGRSHSNGSSPTLRGLFVYEKLLCNARPHPPAGIPAIVAPMVGATTTRQRYESTHAASKACQGCHQLFDPAGFGLEHFDETGRYREQEGGLAIDATGVLPGSTLGFNGEVELSQRLAARSEVAACVTGMMSSYWFGGAGGRSCLAEEARTALTDGQVGLREYAARLAAAPSVTRRSAQ